MQCPDCGAAISENDLFCGECGATLIDPALAETAAEPEAAPPVEPEIEPVPASPSVQPQMERDQRATAAYVLGIVSLVLVATSCLPLFTFAACFGGLLGCLGPIAGLVAAVLGAIVQRDIDAHGGLEENRKKARQGMIMGIVSIVIYVLLIVVGIVVGFGAGILSEL